MRLSPRLPDQLVSLNVNERLAVFGVVSEQICQTFISGHPLWCSDADTTGLQMSLCAKRVHCVLLQTLVVHLAVWSSPNC